VRGKKKAWRKAAPNEENVAKNQVGDRAGKRATSSDNMGKSKKGGRDGGESGEQN